MNRKVTVVGGAGNVGATVARAVANKELADVVLVGIGDYADSANSDVVVITSGVPRKPGMSRDDLLLTNFRIISSVVENVVRHSPNCIIVPVANPLDAMCWAAHRLSGF